MSLGAMTMRCRLLVLIWGALALSLLAHVGHLSAAEQQQQPLIENQEVAQQQQQQQQGRSLSALSALIDWKTYTSVFKKSYSSWMQQLIRQKLFMSKMIQVFLSATKFRAKTQSYYMVINEYSDLTPQEERQKLSGDVGDDDDDNDDNEAEPTLNDEQVEQVLLAELEDQANSARLQLAVRARMPTRKTAPVRRTLQPLTAVAATTTRLERRVKRSVLQDEFSNDADADLDEVALDDLILSDLIRMPNFLSSSDREERGALNIKHVVPSNNPDYLPMEQASLGDFEHRPSEAERLQDVPEEQFKEIEARTSSQLATPLPKVIKVPRANMTKKADKANKSQATGNDLVLKDWRETGCVAPPIQQGRCQSCYAVSSTAFLEWAFCMNQGRVLTPLSAQYMVSCGPQFKEESKDSNINFQFHGCGCGRSRHAMYFVKDYGIELEANMPYMAMDTPCPIEPGTPLKHKGYIRPNVKQSVRMAAGTKQLELALKVGPVIVNFREPIDFLAYGGGMTGGCYQRGGHAMLVVGHGIQDDKPYLIIKNSFGTNWGMRGYFKFNRKYTLECIKDFVLPRISFPSKRSQARRIKAYLAAEHRPVEAMNGIDLSNFDKISF